MGGRHSRPARQSHQQQQPQDGPSQPYAPATVYQQQPPQAQYYDPRFPPHQPFYPANYNYPPGRPPLTYVGHHGYPPQPTQQYAEAPPPPRCAPAIPYGPRVVQPERELTQTATIRNAVNLKKETLRLVPVAGNPNKLAIFFDFDASQAACVTTFLGVTEKPRDGCQLMAQLPPSPAVLYEPGLNNKFPKDPASPVAVIDLSHFTDEALATDKRVEETYPLVIRLESLPAAAKTAGHRLEELQPGAPQKIWVQSQTTYAVILRDDEGNRVPKVIKQKIWVEGVSYELQEIYGMDPGATAAKGKESVEDAEERLCVICLVNERDTTVLPCRHMCMCHECAQELRRQTSKCPICRNHVESLLHIKMQKNAGASRGPVTAPSPGVAPAPLPEGSKQPPMPLPFATQPTAPS